jgi:hypothetical protein
MHVRPRRAGAAAVRAMIAGAMSLALRTLCAALAVALVAGCGSSSHGNGVADKPPAQIVAAAQAAAEKATSVHVTGSIEASGSSESFDVELLAGTGARGKVSLGGASFELIDTGSTVYMKGSSAFYKRVAGSLAAKLLRGKWLKAPAGDPKFAALKRLTDLHRLIASVLSGHGELKKGASTTVEGTAAIPVNDAAKAEAVYVATSGQPYPLQITKQGSGGGKITFDRWNAPVTLTAPAQAIDIAELQAHA